MRGGALHLENDAPTRDRRALLVVARAAPLCLVLLAIFIGTRSVALATPGIVQIVPLGSGVSNLSDVAFNPVTNRVYVSNGNASKVYVVDGSTNAIVAAVPVPPGPLGVAV